MTLTSERARLDGRVVATDLDRALELLADAERARAEAAVLLGGLGSTGLERFLGYVSWDRLVAHRSGCSNRTAHAVMRTARHLEWFPVTAGALLAGRIGWDQAEVLAKAAADLDDAYRADEADLLDAAERLDADEFERVCRLWRDRADAEEAAANAERRHDQRGLTMQFRFDGSCEGRFQLDPLGAEVVARALETKPDSTSSLAEPRTAAQRRADRLVDVCQAALGGEDLGGTGSVGATVDVVIDVETLAGADAPLARIRAELAHGGPIGGPGLDRLLCDASFRALVTDGVSPPAASTSSFAVGETRHGSGLRVSALPKLGVTAGGGHTVTCTISSRGTVAGQRRWRT